MKDWKMYTEIQKLKSLGFKMTSASKKLGINFRTIKKYWNMSAEEFESQKEDAIIRVKRADDFRSDIIEWLIKYPDMTSAQVYDWLAEKYGKDINFAERTLRDYVAELRITEDIPRTSGYRQYEAVDDPPMGYQAQVDMGQIWLKNDRGSRVCVYCFAMVLSHSRYKFVYWIDKPFTTASFIEAHEKAFAFLGGRPQEIVYDQDKVLAVSENHGDIIYTEGFENYRSIMKFKIYLCRGSDPESKGRIEAVVKYAKYNFANHRIFENINTLNEKCIDWLNRRANSKEHEITKKIPAEVFSLEKECLQPVPEFRTITSEKSITYLVRKDNTVMYHSNRYRVPKGTYRPGLQVKMLVEGVSLTIADNETGEVYARHTISAEKGRLIPLSHEDRELNYKLAELYERALTFFDDKQVSAAFLTAIRKEKPRYFRDQLTVIIRTCEDSESEAVSKALSYCRKHNLCSAGDFKDAVQYYEELNKVPGRSSPLIKPTIPDKYKVIQTNVRDISEYKRAMED